MTKITSLTDYKKEKAIAANPKCDVVEYYLNNHRRHLQNPQKRKIKVGQVWNVRNLELDPLNNTDWYFEIINEIFDEGKRLFIAIKRIDDLCSLQLILFDEYGISVSGIDLDRVYEWFLAYTVRRKPIHGTQKR